MPYAALNRSFNFFALGLLLLPALGCKAEVSLVKLIENHPDEFPPPYVAIAPPAQTSALGLQGVAAPADAEPRRRAVLSTASCFFVLTSPSTPGLDEYLVRYKLSKDLRAELELVAVQVGVNLDAVKRVTVELHDLRHEEARLVPNPDGCDFGENASFEVFTRQVVAGTLDLDFGVELNIEPNVEVPIANTAATVGVDGGWHVTSERKLSGKDIVIAALPERWSVRVSSEEHVLGPTPVPTEFEVPDSTARVSVISYDAERSALTLQVNTSLNQDAAQLLEGLGVAGWGKLGESFVLDRKVLQRNFLPEPGNRVISVRWSLRPSADHPDINLVVLEFESLVAAPAAG